MGDGRDWTFVLDSDCDECGVDVRHLDDADLAGLVRSAGRTWQLLLDEHADDAAVRTRPAPEVWAPVEYGEHVRDVLHLYRERTELMLSQDDPLFPDWDPDTNAAAYGTSDPRTVGAEIAVAAFALADVYAGLDAAALARPGRRSDGAEFQVGSLGRYMLHDVLHHVRDADRAL